MHRTIHSVLALCALLLSAACAPSFGIPGPINKAASVASTAIGARTAIQAFQFVTDRSPVPMRGTYRVTYTVGAEQASYYLRTAPMSGIPIMDAGITGSEIVGYGVTVVTANDLEGLDYYNAILQQQEKADEEALKEEAQRRGLGGGFLFLKGDTDKSVTSGSWQTIVSLGIPKGGDAFFDRHRSLFVSYELGQNQGGEEMFEDMEAGALSVDGDAARFQQTIRDEQGNVLFTITGDRLSLEALDYSRGNPDS